MIPGIKLRISRILFSNSHQTTPHKPKSNNFFLVSSTYGVDHWTMGFRFGGTNFDCHVHCHHQHGDKHIWHWFPDSYLRCGFGWEYVHAWWAVERDGARRRGEIVGDGPSRTHFKTQTQTDPVNLVYVPQELCPLCPEVCVLYFFEHPTLHDYDTTSWAGGVREYVHEHVCVYMHKCSPAVWRQSARERGCGIDSIGNVIIHILTNPKFIQIIYSSRLHQTRTFGSMVS